MTSVMSTYRRRVKQACRRNAVAWRYVLNAAGSLGYAVNHKPLSPEARRVVRDLDRDGVAITSIGALPIDPALITELTEAV